MLDVLWLFIPLGIGAICFKAASDKGRSRWIWGLVGTIVPVVGLLFVLFLPRIRTNDAA
jgi:hypothetical protein